MNNKGSCWTLHCDGGCHGNGLPNAIGSWAYILNNGTRQIRNSSWFDSFNGKPPTSNKAEFMACIQGLRQTQEGDSVEVVTDSMVLIHWLNRLVARKPRQKGAMDRVLVEDLNELVVKRKIYPKWVRGHADHPLNNECDEECQRLLRPICSNLTPA